jgi:Ca-activated chloride channel family protein
LSIGSVVGLYGQENVPTFKSGIDLVRVSATVRDQKGRFVKDLTLKDFEVRDGGELRTIADFRRDGAAISVALLFDVSGSMENTLTVARESAMHLLSWLGPDDEAAIFTFDTRLEEVTPFTSGLRTLPASMATMMPFGATSLHDAIARAAERVGTREGRRRAVIVFSDGRDTASRLAAADVSEIASSIDVPVYLFAAVPSIDNPGTEYSAGAGRSALNGSLSDLAARTGGHVSVASTPAARSAAARQIVDELRHQYLISFESSGIPGWHPLVVRARNKDLVVRARSGYIAGQSRPSSD